MEMHSSLLVLCEGNPMVIVQVLDSSQNASHVGDLLIYFTLA